MLDGKNITVNAYVFNWDVFNTILDGFGLTMANVTAQYMANFVNYVGFTTDPTLPTFAWNHTISIAPNCKASFILNTNKVK
jgi:hypothetical protein